VCYWSLPSITLLLRQRGLLCLDSS
jgi:hypothetical protein